MKTIKYGALALSFILSNLVVNAQENQPVVTSLDEPVAVAAVPDSTTAAVATVFGDALRQAAQQEFPGDPVSQEVFMRGVTDAFEIQSTQAAYHQGAATGAILIQQLNQMQQSGLRIDMASVGALIEKVAKGESVGFDYASADAHIQSILNPTLSPESQQAFLDEMAKHANTVKTASGLVFETITEGDGVSPQPTDNVLVTYTGRLADGTVFDQSQNPVVFGVGQLIPGFTEALLMMKKGGHYRIYMPASLGYGEQGAGGGTIPGGAALDFEVVLIDVIPAQAQPETPAQPAN